MSNRNEDENLDLSDGVVSSNNVELSRDHDVTTLKRESTILGFKIWEERFYLGFKALGFIVAMFLAVCFLKTGLELSEKSLTHILEHRTDTTIEKNKKPLKDSSIAAVSQNDNSAIQKEKKSLKDKAALDIEKKSKKNNVELKAEKATKENAKQPTQSMENKMLYSGSIITLVAFILGTGLTLLLTIVKFSFHNRQQNEDNPNVALAGPASELFMALANYIKSKIK
ncbi:hypothetical protein [Pseudoalteromonas sp. HL-AS1]|uniref:hypothetical protein n=1 Tax=Pseudoalteromonas sp. HL-AS1 TaxID=3071081 RepID=UPI002814FD2A|nr:hypothetical protein [Pseudoalteromonas sp. HL-AS1]WMS91353.1 hypothetical protein RB214_02755 [Pseudoalteromonas sp. HL-AS1]WMT83652.1 hypothetical protein PHIACA1_20 [Pseudoalteromonas phage ACA1]WMT83704.1 hypothetical protein PHIACA2_20 [Pseudoalteromonas phage ACA2]WMT83756.1 hypothetical protein PROACA1A_20 [Pseudoalteromonas phage proACA1-A]